MSSTFPTFVLINSYTIFVRNRRPKNRRGRGGGAGGGRGAIISSSSSTISRNNKNVPKQSDILVELAREKLTLMFRNQLKEYYAVVEMNDGVSDVTPMEDERRDYMDTLPAEGITS